jgi:hypothetical protein
VLYPGVFPHLAKLDAPRKDLEAILLTGIPEGVIDGFQNYTGPVLADMLRLNMAIPPSKDADRHGILGGDLAGFPNGRRLPDDVVTIELRAIAGATYPLIDPTYKPDDAALQVTDGSRQGPDISTPYPGQFPYLEDPHGGFETRPPSTQAAHA